MKFLHPEIGPTEVVFRKNSSRVSARWKNGVAVFSFPDAVDRSRIPEYIDRMAAKVIKRRHDVSFSEDMVLELEGFTFRFSRQNIQPINVWGTIKGSTAYIEVGSMIDMDSLNARQTISKIMCNIARNVASGVLIPRAREIAASLGLKPRSWAIMNGFKTFGKCTSSGDIYLSYICLFLTQELRDYIVCHELAHLSEMSHSRRFHAICDKYCNGREHLLTAMLRNYPWPILRR